MSATTVTITGGGGTEELIAANEYRDELTVQLQSQHPAYLGFGEDAVSATGIGLLCAGDSVRITGAKARLAVNGIAVGNAVIGIETMVGVEYRSTTELYVDSVPEEANAKGSAALTATTAQIVAANASRDSITIQLVSGDPASIGIGVAAVFGEGLLLNAAGDYVTISDHQGILAINGICDTGNSASVSYQES